MSGYVVNIEKATLENERTAIRGRVAVLTGRGSGGRDGLAPGGRRGPDPDRTAAWDRPIRS